MTPQTTDPTVQPDAAYAYLCENSFISVKIFLSWARKEYIPFLIWLVVPGGGDKWGGERCEGADGGNVEAHNDARRSVDLFRYMRI